ncbi:DUF262 domain-containing protein [Paracidovorax avenae]
MRLVLDGHQRLSTLIAILGPALEGYRRADIDNLSYQEEWIFDVSDDDEIAGELRFKLLRNGGRPMPKQVPLGIALDRVKLNDWVRKQKKLNRDEIRRVDSLRDRLREFSIPVATLAAESLDEATETFKRVNSSGTPMSDFHMVAALAYTNGFDPQEQFEKVRSELLEPVGWGDFDDAAILRVCAGLVRRAGDASQHPAKLEIARLSQSLRADVKLIEKAGTSIANAASLLRKAVGVHGAEALPYSWQLIVLAIELGDRSNQELKAKEITQFARWFWLTTYGGVFAGVNSAIVDRAGRALSEMLLGKDETAMQLDIGRRVEEPGRFDFRAARARACLLAIAREQDDGNLNGRTHRALVEGSKAVQTLIPKGGRSIWYNLVIENDYDRLRSLRDALKKKAAGEKGAEESKILAEFSIRPKDKGDVDQLIQHRRMRILSGEKEFVEQLGFDWRDSSLRSA